MGSIGDSDKTIQCRDGRRRPDGYWKQRGEQRRLLDDLRLPKSILVGSAKIASATVRHVLRTIDDFLESPYGREGEPLSVNLITKRTSLSRETVLRAIRALNDLKIVDGDGYTDPHYGRCYRFVIHWELTARREWKESRQPPCQIDTQIDGQIDGQIDAHTLLRATARATNAQQPQHQGAKAPSEENKHQTAPCMHASGAALDSSPEKRWCVKRGITKAHLADPGKVQELYQLAVQNEHCDVPDTPDVRFRFFAYCHYAYRTDEVGIGLWQARLSDGYSKWQTYYDDEHDTKWARAAIRKLDSPAEGQAKKTPSRRKRKTQEQQIWDLAYDAFQGMEHAEARKLAKQLLTERDYRQHLGNGESPWEALPLHLKDTIIAGIVDGYKVREAAR